MESLETFRKHQKTAEKSLSSYQKAFESIVSLRERMIEEAAALGRQIRADFADDSIVENLAADIAAYPFQSFREFGIPQLKPDDRVSLPLRERIADLPGRFARAIKELEG